MSCDPGLIQWEIHMFNDADPDQDNLLTFCLRFTGVAVTGRVSLDVEGELVLLDDRVRGTRKPIPVPEDPEGAMDLSFRWDDETEAIRVFLGGHVFKEDEAVRFIGRFHAFATDEQFSAEGIEPGVQAARLLGPGDGDTGTGTGQQT
jgi:hypothetical protein